MKEAFQIFVIGISSVFLIMVTLMAVLYGFAAVVRIWSGGKGPQKGTVEQEDPNG